MMLPNRIGKLIERIEVGDPVTQKDVDRIAVLQALDVAKLGEDFVKEFVVSEREHSKALEP